VSQPSSNWLQQIPAWVWWSCFPAFGGMAIAYAGIKTSTTSWIAIGVSFTAVGIAFSNLDPSGTVMTIAWMAQIATAFALKKSYLIKTYPKHLPLPDDAEAVKLISSDRPKFEINSCSKNDLVNSLGLPIVYANDIEILRNEGFIFTYAEELTEVVGIPAATVKRIAPMITFSYDYRQEASLSWKRLNTLSTEELIAQGLEAEIAQEIVNERQKRGEYKSLVEVKKRTGVPFSAYKSLI
jgi:DNA uptake protein ComE-like DNA-binding protein